MYHWMNFLSLSANLIDLSYFFLVNLSSLFIIFCCPYCPVWSGSSHRYIYKVIVTDFLYLRVSSLNFFVLSFLCLTSRSGSCWNHFYSFSFLVTDYCTSIPKKILKFYYAFIPNTGFQPQMHPENFLKTPIPGPTSSGYCPKWDIGTNRKMDRKIFIVVFVNVCYQFYYVTSSVTYILKMYFICVF